jgi:Tfp pilus assembly protein PilX
MKPVSNQVRHAIKTRGFALVVTLSLMILLTIIAVGLLTLSSISLRASTASAAMAEARQNARMAMQLAVGELQKQAGPDQRVTATANIAGDSTGGPLAAGASPTNDKSINGIDKGLKAVQPGTRYWTGVWKNSNTTSTAGTEIYTKTPSPSIVQWLISGSDASSTGPTILPSDGKYAVSASGKVSNPEEAVILAGEKTVGASATDRYVVAPVLEMTDKNSKVNGRFAWWVGDEGVKAKINIATTNTDSNSYASLAAQRRGWETVDGFTNYPTPSSGGHASLPKIISLPETALLVPGANSATGGSTPLQAAFHSATADSRAVIADVLNGGTKIDLTAILSSDLPASKPSNAESVENYPVSNGKIIPSGTGYPWGSSMQAPRWDTLKEFYNRYAGLDSGSLVVKAATNKTLPSTAPLVTDFRLIMGAKFVPKGGAAAATTATAFRIHPCAKIAIAIANPYSVPLKWTQDLEFRISNKTPDGNGTSRLYINGGPAADGKGSFLPRVPNRDVKSGAEAAVFHEAVFQIPADTLPPGEARAYTIGAPIVRPAGSTSKVNIKLVPFASADPANFENCIEMQVSDTDAKTPPVTLDVRESWQTTLAMLEMKLAGASSSSQPLLQIESFEIDSALDFQKGTRKFNTAAECSKMTKPFAMQLFNLQISQPGADYASLFTGSAYFTMGQRASTMRTFADFNLAATRLTKPITCYNPPPYFSETSDSPAALPKVAPGGDTGSKFTSNMLSNPLKWGRGPGGVNKTILFSIPKQISSLAQFQHADLTGDNDQGSIGHQPGNAFGNSYASPFVKRHLTNETRTNYVVIGIKDQSGAKQESKRFYDISYLLNASIWDTYFLSTIPKGSTTPEMPTIIKLNGDASSTQLNDPMLTASHLMIEGGFNINSTDKDAWKAFLASGKHFKHQADSGTSTNAAFPRSLEQTSPAANQPTGTAADSFSGFRRLTDTQLEALATEITQQVRLRGPFVSLSHFVNRALAPLDNNTRALSRSGAIQLALDESGANINLAASKSAFATSGGFKPTQDKVTFQVKDGVPRSDFDGPIETMWGKHFRPADANPSMPDWGKTSDGAHYGSVASIISDRKILNDTSFKPEQGYRSTGIPGWLTQADVLQVIGPSITNRSDTFRIRSFGEALDASGKSVAKAYCEAIVQRVPAYVDPADSPSARGSLSPLNTTYGRQFQVVSFRWLSPQEV